MKIKNANLEYWVFYVDNKVPTRMNILKGMEENIAKEIRKGNIYDKSILKEYLRTEFVYNYWGKTEFEYGICDVFEKDIENIGKFDVWFQIELNLDMIADYIISKMEIDFKGE